MSDDDVKLGYIGLGNMGAPIAKRLIDWPGGLTVFDVRVDAMTPFAEAGATLADSVADVAAADIISVTVLDDAQVREVVGELAANAKPGTVIAIHSTISPTPARSSWPDELEPQGIHIVDAPVSGGAGAAKKGELAAMVGADRRGVRADQGPASQAVGVTGDPRRRTRRRHANEAGPQHAYTSSPSPPRARRSKLAEASGLNLQELGKVVRHTDAITGGPGAIMVRDDMAPLEPDHFLYGPLPAHARARREGPQSGACTG